MRAPLPFGGVDLWTAYEITWLDAQGKPRIAIGEFRVPADSPSIVESKSLKLYLGSFAQEAASIDEIARRIEADLAHACGAAVTVALSPATSTAGVGFAALPGEVLDEIELATDVYEPEPGSLAASGGNVDETLRSALFRSRCPVTGQPDYGDVMIRYRGMRIDRPSAAAKGGTIPGVRTPIIIGGRAMAAERPAPRLGEDTAEILREIGEG